MGELLSALQRSKQDCTLGQDGIMCANLRSLTERHKQELLGKLTGFGRHLSSCMIPGNRRLCPFPSQGNLPFKCEISYLYFLRRICIRYYNEGCKAVWNGTWNLESNLDSLIKLSSGHIKKLLADCWQKALNSTPHELLHKQAKNRDFNGRVLSFIEAFLNGRQSRVRMRGILGPLFTSSIGVRKGRCSCRLPSTWWWLSLRIYSIKSGSLGFTIYVDSITIWTKAVHYGNKKMLSKRVWVPSQNIYTEWALGHPPIKRCMLWYWGAV